MGHGYWLALGWATIEGLAVDAVQYVVLNLTEQCHETFHTRFLPNSDPSGPLIHKLKYFFAYGVDFAEIFARKKNLRCVIDTDTVS